jgi:hypothetical protein
MNMSFKHIISLLICIFVFADSFSQKTLKRAEAVRIYSSSKINGIPDEDYWKNCPVATNFYQYSPVNGSESKYNTEVRIAYDNTAIYVFARMYDPYPDSIPRELGTRDDQNLNADYFNISINPFNDGIHEFIFAVTSSGIQLDIKSTGAVFDDTWDAVWQSAVTIDSLGWTAELKIPHSAIRFPHTLGKAWGINFWRAHQRSQEVSCWNRVDNSNDENANQSGELYGIAGIVPPLRLSFVPYVSMYLDNYPYGNSFKENTSTAINGGMDVKLGINESFTFDMTLIPDFGQVQSDNIILNLSPFEVKYDEKRPFFTEGTELFSKADLFYSRRIGSKPLDYDKAAESLNTGDTITENPHETQLINASKFSGRTSKGLGIGIFNATSGNTYARIRDSVGNTRKFLTQALTNYNIIVLDQVFRKNSFISFVNTNVYYDKGGRMANVSGTEFKLANKKNSFALFGSAALSEKFDSLNANADKGYKYDLSFGKMSGKFKFMLTQILLSDKFDINDLGFLEYNNSVQNILALNYNFYNPFWKLMSLYNALAISQTNQYKPYKYSTFEITSTSVATLKDFSTLTLMGDVIPIENYDFFEPRIPGRYLTRPTSWWVYAIYASDMRKKIFLDLNAGYLNSKGDFKDSFWWLIGPHYRISNRLSVNYSLSIDHEWHDVGFVASDSIIRMGNRDVRRIENNFGINYIFTKDVSFNIQARHYWSTVKYLQFYNLNNDGSLQSTTYSKNQNESFNAFNIDMVFSWRFAPGSDINLVWKNQILDDTKLTGISFSDNFRNTMNASQLNSISLKLMYYLDYQYLVKKNKKNVK